MNAADVLSAFRADAVYLLFGGAFVAVGVVSAAFAIIRRKLDPLLVYFAAGLPVAAAADAILNAVRSWSAKQDDDLTLLICDYLAEYR